MKTSEIYSAVYELVPDVVSLMMKLTKFNIPNYRQCFFGGVPDFGGSKIEIL